MFGLNIPKISCYLHANIPKSEKIQNWKHFYSQAFWLRDIQPVNTKTLFPDLLFIYCHNEYLCRIKLLEMELLGQNLRTFLRLLIKIVK